MWFHHILSSLRTLVPLSGRSSNLSAWEALDDVAAFDHKVNFRRVRQQSQIGQWITGYPDEVTPRAGCERPHALHANGLCRNSRRSPYAVDWRHPQLVHEKELLAIGAMWPDPRVGSKGDLDSGLYSLLDARRVVGDYSAGLVGRVGRHLPCFGVPDDPRRGDQGRYQRIVTVEHHLDCVAVEPYAVLDRGDAPLQCVLDACIGLGVSHHLAPLCRGLLDSSSYLFDSERRMVRLVAGREDAAGCA